MKNKNKPDEFKDELIDLLDKHKKLPANYIRDKNINLKYRGMLSNGTLSDTVREILSDEYCTGEKNIQKIVYKKKCDSGIIIIIID